MTWALEEILKNFHFNGLLLNKVYIVWAKKVQRTYLCWSWREGQNLERIWRGIDLSFQNWHKEFNKIWHEHSKVSKISTLMGTFWAKYVLFELKTYSGIIFHETEERYKFVEESTCPFKIGIRNLTKFDPSTCKSQTFSF